MRLSEIISLAALSLPEEVRWKPTWAQVQGARCCVCTPDMLKVLGPLPHPCASISHPKSCTTALTFGKCFETSGSVTQAQVLPPRVQVNQHKSLQRNNGVACLKIGRNPLRKHLSRHDRKINPGRLLLALYESSCCYSNFVSAPNLKTKHSWNNITALS